MRSLVVTRWAPWPSTSGARYRSANVISALADLGEVDVFILGDPRLETALTPPHGLAIGRGGHALRADRPARRLERVGSLAPWSRPAAIRRQDDAAGRNVFSSWATGSAYDLAWFVRIESWLALGALVDARSIIDYDDLRDQLLQSRLRSDWPDPLTSASPSGLVRTARRVLRKADARAWSRLQSDTAREVEAAVVCSELDMSRLAVPNAVIVPNGVDLPDEAVGQVDVGSPPVLMFQGSLSYAPNTDAASILVRDVLPRVRTQAPDVTVRLVGRVDDRVARLGAVPGVVVTGPVVDMTAELARADVVAVPLRQGAGTRIKVLEALAHRIPVVATSVAVEGLDTIHDDHLLVADEPDAFAAACVRLLRDRDLRMRLAAAGERLVRERYGWEHSRIAVRQLAGG